MSKTAVKRFKWAFLIAVPILLLAALFPAMRARREYAATRALLLECSYKARIPEIKRFIAQGADVNGRCPGECPSGIDKEQTALYLSVFSAAPDVTAAMKTLLDAGADPNLATDYGHTPLMLAAASLSPERVELLIEHGADVNQRTQPIKFPDSPTPRTMSALDFNGGFLAPKFQRSNASRMPPNKLKRIREMLLKAGAK